MPGYFFDTYDGECAIKDQEGITLADDNEARAWATRSRTEMVEGASPHQNPTQFKISVRNERGVLGEEAPADGSFG